LLKQTPQIRKRLRVAMGNQNSAGAPRKYIIPTGRPALEIKIGSWNALSNEYAQRYNNPEGFDGANVLWSSRCRLIFEEIRDSQRDVAFIQEVDEAQYNYFMENCPEYAEQFHVLYTQHTAQDPTGKTRGKKFTPRKDGAMLLVSKRFCAEDEVWVQTVRSHNGMCNVKFQCVKKIPGTTDSVMLTFIGTHQRGTHKDASSGREQLSFALNEMVGKTEDWVRAHNCVTGDGSAAKSGDANVTETSFGPWALTVVGGDFNDDVGKWDGKRRSNFFGSQQLSLWQTIPRMSASENANATNKVGIALDDAAAWNHVKANAEAYEAYFKKHDMQKRSGPKGKERIITEPPLDQIPDDAEVKRITTVPDLEQAERRAQEDALDKVALVSQRSKPTRGQLDWIFVKENFAEGSVVLRRTREDMKAMNRSFVRRDENNQQMLSDHGFECATVQIFTREQVDRASGEEPEAAVAELPESAPDQ